MGCEKDFLANDSYFVARCKRRITGGWTECVVIAPRDGLRRRRFVGHSEVHQCLPPHGAGARPREPDSPCY